MLLKRAFLPLKCKMLLLMLLRAVQRSEIINLGTKLVLAASGPNNTGSHHPARFTQGIAVPSIPM